MSNYARPLASADLPGIAEAIGKLTRVIEGPKAADRKGVTPGGLPVKSGYAIAVAAEELRGWLSPSGDVGTAQDIDLSRLDLECKAALRELHGALTFLPSFIRDALGQRQETLAWLGRLLEKIKDKADGPVPPNILQWGSRRVKVPARTWRLLAYMWSKDSAPIEDVVENVWDGKEVIDITVRSECSKATNGFLLLMGIPWELKTKDGHVVKHRHSA